MFCLLVEVDAEIQTMVCVPVISLSTMHTIFNFCLALTIWIRFSKFSLCLLGEPEYPDFEE